MGKAHESVPIANLELSVLLYVCDPKHHSIFIEFPKVDISKVGSFFFKTETRLSPMSYTHYKSVLVFNLCFQSVVLQTVSKGHPVLF